MAPESYLDNEAIQNMQISESVADCTLGILHHILMKFSDTSSWEVFSYGCCVKLDYQNKNELTNILISALQHGTSSQLIDKMLSISRYFELDIKKFFERLTKYEYKFIFLNEKPLLESFLEQLQEPNISKYKDAPAYEIIDRISDFFENQNDTDKKTIIFVDENSIDNALVFDALLRRIKWKAVFVWFRPLSDFDGEVAVLDKICEHGGDFRILRI